MAGGPGGGQGNGREDRQAGYQGAGLRRDRRNAGESRGRRRPVKPCKRRLNLAIGQQRIRGRGASGIRWRHADCSARLKATAKLRHGPRARLPLNGMSSAVRVAGHTKSTMCQNGGVAILCPRLPAGCLPWPALGIGAVRNGFREIHHSPLPPSTVESLKRGESRLGTHGRCRLDPAEGRFRCS